MKILSKSKPAGLRLAALCFLALLVLVPASSATTISLASTFDARFDGTTPNGFDLGAGTSVAAAGDINGDGRPDYLIGDPNACHNGVCGGSVYVVFGKPGAGINSLDALVAAGGADRIDGAKDGDQAGYSVAGAGDVNGDGIPDILIGALGVDRPPGFSSGAAYVVFGQTASQVISLASLGSQGYEILGPTAGNPEAGLSVANAGDVNGDGRPDAIIGAPFAVSGPPFFFNSGAAFVVFGKSDSSTIDLDSLGSQGYQINGATNSSGNAGLSVAGIGDVNGDGRPDAAVGANANSGAANAYVVFGQSSGAGPVDLGQLVAQGRGQEIRGVNGPGIVAGAGDVNGDGIPDLLVGAPFASSSSGALTGAAFVVFEQAGAGQTNLGNLAGRGYRIDGISQPDATGSAVASAGDVNGDGTPDALIGAPMPFGDGAAFVVFGKSGTDTVSLASLGVGGHHINGAAAGDHAGASLASVGDVNVDGRPDILIGAPGADNGGTGSGSAYLVLTPPPLIKVGIDVIPRVVQNSSTSGMGTIPVAILSSPTFDAPARVAKSSLTFGRAGDEPSLVRCDSHPTDVNGDRLPDLLCLFSAKVAGFLPGDAEAILLGTTVDGISIQGKDQVRVLVM